jgi:hypothetical protein
VAVLEVAIFLVGGVISWVLSSCCSRSGCFVIWVVLVIFVLSGGVLLTMKFQPLLRQQRSSVPARIWLLLVVFLGGYGAVGLS